MNPLEAMADRAGRALAALPFRDREVLKLRFGLGDGYAYSTSEIGRIWKKDARWTRRATASALRRLDEGEPRVTLDEVRALATARCAVEAYRYGTPPRGVAEADVAARAERVAPRGSLAEPAIKEVDVFGRRREMTEFLCRHDWPFHREGRLTAEQAQAMLGAPPSKRSFWLDVDGGHAGLLRVLDLDDPGGDCPVLDLRVAPEHRGRGIGRRAFGWAAAMVFRAYPGARRVEATVRADDAASRGAMEDCGFQLEGVLRETWPTQDGRRAGTAVYGLLRGEFEGAHVSAPDGESPERAAT